MGSAFPPVPDLTRSGLALPAAVQARVRANAGILPSPLNRRRCGALGDSISADSCNGAGGTTWTNWGYLAWLRRHLGQRIDLPTARVYAVAGRSIANVVDEQLPAALGDALDIAFVHVGTNSLGSDTTANLTTGPKGLKTVYDALRANSTFVVAIPIRVHGPATAITGANLKQMAAIARWQAEYCRANAGILFVDVNAAYLDFATGNARSGLLRDDTHDLQAGAMQMGRLVADAVAPLVPAVEDRLLHLGDVFDAAANPRGNLLVNGLLAGSATGYPNLQNGATGNVPTGGWAGLRSTTSSSVTATFSKESDPAFTGLTKAVMTVGGTADTTLSLLQQYVDLTGLVSPPAPGDAVQAECEVEYAINAGSFAGLTLRLDADNAADAVLASSIDGDQTLANGTLPPGSATLTYRTEPLVIPPNTRYLRFRLYAGTGASGTLDGVFKVRRCAMRKVS